MSSCRRRPSASRSLGRCSRSETSRRKTTTARRCNYKAATDGREQVGSRTNCRSIPPLAAILVVTYSNDTRAHRGGFDVLVDGAKVGEQAMERRTPEQDVRFFDVKYPLPLEVVKGKQKVTVRFQTKDGDEIPGVFGIRTVRADAAQ